MMTMNPDPRRMLHQIVAVNLAQQDAPTIRARIGSRPFHVGSSTDADLCLQGDAIQAMHLRLYLTTNGQVMLTNLGAPGSVQLDSTPLAQFACVNWKPGNLVRLGFYEIKLQTVLVRPDARDVEEIHPPVITQEQEAVGSDPPPNGDASLELKTLIKPLPAEPLDSAQLDALQTLREAPDAESPALPDAQQAPRDFVHPLADHTPSLSAVLSGTASLPADERRKIAQGFELASTPGALSTLPRYWQHSGHLSAQLLINPVNCVAGERVRLPLAVRNNGGDPLAVAVHVSGVPQLWLVSPSDPITVAGAKIMLTDLVLEIPEDAGATALEASVELSCPDDPGVQLVLPLALLLKQEPNLVGQILPVEADSDTQSVVLQLQNCTRAGLDVFVAGHSTTPALDVVPAQLQLRLPPGQIARIPLQFHVHERPMWQGITYQYAVSAFHEGRAPLDFVGSVTIQPRLRRGLR
ncbi:MAG: hypothetical protein Kow0077_25630 [Anaerolineae bacterium]